MRGIVNSCWKVLVLIALFTSCNQSSKMEYDDKTTTQSIAWLKAQCSNPTTTIRTTLSCEGMVTANDAYGELYRRIVVEDTTAALTIVIERSDLYRDYPIGTTLCVDCNGLTLCDYGGKIELGTGVGETGYTEGLNREEELRHLHGAPATVHPTPQPIRFEEINAMHIDRLVRFDEVRFLETGSWCDRDPETGRPITTERTLIDPTGAQFTVRTLGMAHYADEPLPEGKGSLCGIVDYFGGRFTLRVVNRSILF